MRALLPIVLGVLVVLYTPYAHCQISEPGDSISLTGFLRSLETQHDTHFSFNPRFTNALYITLPPESSGEGLQSGLDWLREQLPLTFKADGANGYIVVPRRSDVKFVVTDSSSGEPVSLIFIRVNEVGQGYVLAKNGNYVLKDISPTDTIRLESSFLSPRQWSGWQVMKEGGILELTPDIIYLDEVSITAFMTSGVDYKLSTHSLQVDMNDLNLLAGEADGDVLNVLSTMPGIRAPDGKPGNLNIRGNTFDQNLIYFDDIPIYHKGHYFGAFSPYNPGIVSSIEVQRGALQANWGGRVGGLIDIKTDDQLADSASYGLLANTVYASGRMKAPLVKDRLSIYLSARGNYPIDYQSPKLDAFSVLNLQGSKISLDRLDNSRVLERFDVRFQDVNGKLLYQINDKQRASMSFMYINNDFAFDFNSVNRNLFEQQEARMDNWGVTWQWAGNLSEKFSLSAKAVMSSITLHEENKETDNGTIRRDDEVQNVVDDVRLLTRGRFELSDKATALFGYELFKQKTELLHFGTGSAQGGDRSASGLTHGIYGSVETTLADKLVASIGVRVDHFAPLRETFIDPRLSITYLISKRWHLKASGGRAHQYLKQEFPQDFNDFRIGNQFWFLSEEEASILEGYQGMIGWTFDSPGWLIDFEAYRKSTNGVLLPNDPNSQTPARFGKLQTTGLDFFVKKRWTRTESWLSFSLSRTITDFGAEEVAFYDQTHVLSLVQLWKAKRWKFAMAWKLASGMPVVLPDESELDPSESLNINYTNRFPFQHQMDISATYSFPKEPKGWSGVIGFSVLNAYNNENTINIFQQNPDPNNSLREAVGIAPNIQISIAF